MTLSTSEQTGEDMTNARAGGKLDVPKTRELLHGSAAEWERYRQVVDVLSNDPIFDKSQRSRHYQSRSEEFRNSLSVQHRIEELRGLHGWSEKEVSIAARTCGEGMAMNLHSVAFEPVVFAQGSPDLLAKFGPLIKNRAIIGCYLQTELGHGTNVQCLETTATYLPEHEEFEICSPTLTSSKWWIGGLGKTATHGVVQARLILPDGKDVGPHLFLVQLRSLDDHTVLPGIKIGDIGPKTMGAIGGLDNGFARFDHYRIPRTHMLSKFSQVTKEGNYVKPPHAKISYGGMLYIRSGMVTSAGHVLGKAATVAIRYCTVRRQGNKGADGLECQVITYPSVHQRLLPILSRAYVYTLLGRTIVKEFEAMSSRLSSGDASLLADLHAMTSGLKVLVSTTSVQDVETARRAMGGHGYSAFAGLGKLYAENLPSATYEGDNFVLDQQVVRAAIKSYQSCSQTSDFPPFSRYLRLLKPGATPPDLSTNDISVWADWRKAIDVLEWRSARILEARSRAHAQSADEAREMHSDQRVSRAVSEAFVATQVGIIITGLPLGGTSAIILTSLFKLYLLTTIESALVDLLSLGLFSTGTISSQTDPTKTLRISIAQLCQELLPEAVSLTDAFGLSDWELDSALGVYDGRVYEALWAQAQTEPLNSKEVPDGYAEFIKPMLERGRERASKSIGPKL